MWDVGTRNLLKALNGHEDVVYYAEEFEWAIVSSSMDTIIKLWQIKPVPPYPITTLRIAKVEQYAIEINGKLHLRWVIVLLVILYKGVKARPILMTTLCGNQVNLGIMESLQLRIDNRRLKYLSIENCIKK